MGAYNYFVISGDPRNYRRRLERAKRARSEKRDKVRRALVQAGFVERDGVWIAIEKTVQPTA